MFRTQTNPMDDAVVKATDENLTSENWEYILDVCDRVGATPSGPAHAVSALIKRLAHRNANVQLYTLELAHALSQNCGAPLHRELASKAFTDALLRLAGDRNTHGQVKRKVLERMGGWVGEFGPSPELGIMEQAFARLRSQQPGLVPPPSKPGKVVVSGEERRREEEELQMALALSVRENKGGSAGGAGGGGGGGTVRDDGETLPAQAGAGVGGSEEKEQAGAAAHAAHQQGTTAATVSRVRALYDFTPSESGELAFRKGDTIAVLESVYKDWWKGSLRGNTGIFPLNYVEKLQDPSREELERDALMEGEVFGEIKSVEKLLALLSVRGEGGAGGRRGEREEEEVSELYQRTLSIRPKLIELIGKYSQKKDDFTQLNEKFIKARRDYEALLESSMSQPQYQQPQQYPLRPRQSSQGMYPPQHQQPPYGGPLQPQAYPPQTAPQGYPPPQPFAQPPQQDPQRFYSPAPSEPPQQAPSGPLPQAQAQGGYGSPYPAGPPSNGGPNGGAAPFHFIPGGVQQQQQQQPQQQPPRQPQQQPPDQPQPEIRRKPSPAAPSAPPPDTFPSQPPHHQHHPSFQQQQQQHPRPPSIHTLNSGHPQELAGASWGGDPSSPVDARGSYVGQQPTGVHAEPARVPPLPPGGQEGGGYAVQPDAGYAAPPPQQQEVPQSGGYQAYAAPPPQQGQEFQQPGSPGMAPPQQPQQQGGYQAYQPQQPQQQGVGGGGGDAEGFYR